MLITLSPALLVSGIAWARATGIAELPIRPDAVGTVEILCVGVVVAMSVLGVIDALRVNGGRNGWAWSVGNGGYIELLNWLCLYGVAFVYLGWAAIGAASSGYVKLALIGVTALGGILVLLAVGMLLITLLLDSRPTSGGQRYEPRNK